MTESRLNRADDDYSLYSYTVAYDPVKGDTFVGVIHTVKSALRSHPNVLERQYRLAFEDEKFSMKIESFGINDLIRQYEARARVRGLIPLIDRSIYVYAEM
jgi:hypothetical protein